MLEIQFTPVQNEPDRYIADKVIKHERFSFGDFQRAFGGQAVTDPAELGKFLNVPHGYKIWRTAAGHYRCICPNG